MRCVCTSIKPGRHVAPDKSAGAAPPGAEVEAAGPTAVIVPFESNTMTWSVSIRPERTSSSLPQRTAPGAAKTRDAASVITNTNERNSRILRINPPQFWMALNLKPCSIHLEASVWETEARRLLRDNRVECAA